jgi:hypothetical protein
MWVRAIFVACCLYLVAITNAGDCFTVEFEGRTGNLMFEYAALLGLCTYRGQDYRACAFLAIPSWTFWPVNEFVTEFNLQQAACQITPGMTISEKTFSFDEDIMHAPSGSALHGWLQSWKYFHPHAEHIVREVFALPNRSVTEAESFISSIRTKLPLGTHLIAVHVRVGDKVHDQKFKQRYDQWSLSEAYYRKAIRLLQLRHPHSALVIFSGGGETKDDLRRDRQWTKERFGTAGTHVFYDESEDHFASLKAIGLCDSVVVAHSTFSWWGAYLSSTLEVVAPYHYFTPQIELEKKYKIEDYYLPWWSVISQNSSEDRIIGWNALHSVQRNVSVS